MPKTNRDIRLPKFSIRKVKFYRRKKAKTKNRRFVCRKKRGPFTGSGKKKSCKTYVFLQPDMLFIFPENLLFSFPGMP